MWTDPRFEALISKLDPWIVYVQKAGVSMLEGRIIRFREIAGSQLKLPNEFCRKKCNTKHVQSSFQLFLFPTHTQNCRHLVTSLPMVYVASTFSTVQSGFLH